jgi:hypothetical protein
VTRERNNNHNNTTPVGELDVSLLTYSFRITTWRWQEVQKIDRKTRRILTVYKMHHPQADTHRLYVKMKEARGLLQIEAAHISELNNIADCIRTKHK